MWGAAKSKLWVAIKWLVKVPHGEQLGKVIAHSTRTPEEMWEAEVRCAQRVLDLRRRRLGSTIKLLMLMFMPTWQYIRILFDYNLLVAAPIL